MAGPGSTHLYCVCVCLCVCVQVIEVLVRAEQGLFREVVKHLNQVEEQVVERLAWEACSPLWDTLRQAKDPAPTCQEVHYPLPPHSNILYALPQFIDDGEKKSSNVSK